MSTKTYLIQQFLILLLKKSCCICITLITNVTNISKQKISSFSMCQFS